MGITTAVADSARKGKEFRELYRETSPNSKSRKNRRRPRKNMSPIQTLFDTCQEVFADSSTNVVPPPADVERIKMVLDGIRPEDLGLGPEMPYFRVRRVGGYPMITYLHLYESENFSMGIFCLPPSGVIPLHNHPGMTVFSKILFGTMHIKSYDWVVGAPNSNSVGYTPQAEPRLAKAKKDSDFTAPCETSILYPADGGNMHCFTAVTACAVLDVLGPPYSDPNGRHCTYYLDHPFSSISVDGVSIQEEERGGYAWLEERETPEGLSVVGDIYRGPMFVEN